MTDCTRCYFLLSVHLDFHIVLCIGKNLGDADRFGSSSSNFPEGVDNRILTLISNLENRVKLLEDTRAEDVRRMGNMQSEIDELKSENRRLQNLSSHRDVVTVKSGTERTSSVYRHDDDELGPRNAEIRQDPALNQTSVSEQNEGVPIQEAKTSLSRRHPQKEPSIHKDSIRVAPTNTVMAFHAILGSDIQAPAVNHEIAFDRIITNRGNLYSEHTGTFTCQHPGTYVFSWSIRVQSGHYLDSHVVKNGAIIGSIISASGYHGNTNSGMVVAQMDSGDKVWVKIGNHDSGSNVYAYWSMFSGFKLS